MNISELKQLVENSPSSIFSKDDVIGLLNKVSTQATFRQSQLQDAILRSVEHGDFHKTLNVDEDEAISVSLDGNQIELELDTSRIEVNESFLARIIIDHYGDICEEEE